MKTAMTELRCLVKSMLQNGGDNDLWAVLSHIDDKLEKEKEQIIEANIAGMEFIAVHPDKYKDDAEGYYNQTYKQ